MDRAGQSIRDREPERGVGWLGVREGSGWWQSAPRAGFWGQAPQTATPAPRAPRGGTPGPRQPREGHSIRAVLKILAWCFREGPPDTYTPLTPAERTPPPLLIDTLQSSAEVGTVEMMLLFNLHVKSSLNHLSLHQTPIYV